MAEYIELTEDGKIATNPDVSPVEQSKARFRLAIEAIPPFKTLYERFKGNKLSSEAILRHVLIENGFPQSQVSGAVNTFILNAKYVGILRTVAGVERVFSVEHVMEELERTGKARGALPASKLPVGTSTERISEAQGSREKISFYLTPIGDPDSETRKHADLFLNSIVEQAIEEFGLKVVRADHIAQPGMITRQVIEHVVNAR